MVKKGCPIHFRHCVVRQDHVIGRVSRKAVQRLGPGPAERDGNAAGRKLAFKDGAVDELVIDHKDALHSHRDRDSPGIFGHRQRDLEPEAGALPHIAVHPDRPAHEFDQPTRDGQAKAGAFELAVLVILDLIELTEDVVKVFRRDADTGVLDRDMQGLRPVHDLHPDDPGQDMALFSELHRVADQVGKHLAQAPGIADKAGRQEHVEIDHEIDALFPRPGLEEHRHLMDRAFEIKGFGAQRQALCLDLRIIQNIVDDDQKRLTGRADGFGEKTLFIRQAGVAQQFRHADDTVHRGTDLMAHVGKEGRFCPVGSFSRLAGCVQLACVFLFLRDVDAKADTAAVGGDVVMRAHPAAIGQLLFEGAAPRAILADAFGEPFLFAPDGIGVLAVCQTVAKDVVKALARLHGRGRVRVNVAVPLVAGQKSFLPVIKDKTIGDRLDGGPDAHAFGDIERVGDDVARSHAAILQLDPDAGAQLDCHRLNLILTPARQHEGLPVLNRLVRKLKRAAMRKDAHNVAVAVSRRDAAWGKGGQIGAIGRNQLVVGVKHGKAVMDGVDCVPKPALCGIDADMGAVKIFDKAQVLVLQHLSFGQGKTHDLTLLDDLVGQRAGVNTKLFVCSEKFPAFLFQQAFGREPCPPFPDQPFRKIHARPADILPATRTRPGQISIPTLTDQNEPKLNGKGIDHSLASPRPGMRHFGRLFREVLRCAGFRRPSGWPRFSFL